MDRVVLPGCNVAYVNATLPAHTVKLYVKFVPINAAYRVQRLTSYSLAYTLMYDERPPSAEIVVPVSIRDSSEARNTAIEAMSWGSPTENG